MNHQPSPSNLQTAILEAIETDLHLSIKILEDTPYATLSEMIHYHLGWRNTSMEARGKRFRPLLALLCCQASGGDWRSALPLASCLELIHNFSLIHDDIQDGSHMRRGQPAVWKRWGTPQAINTGDAMFVLARLAALRLNDTGTPANKIVRALSIIDLECLNLTKGQFLDLEFERQEAVSEDAYIEMISGKTCALMRASTQCGALIGTDSPDVLKHFRDFGYQLGLAFQIVDDLLGIWGEAQVTGKSSEDDLLNRKKTMPVIYGLKHSPKFAQLWSSARKTPSDIKKMRHILEEAGAEEHARKAATEATSRALQALEALSLHEPASKELKDLTVQLQTRRR
jgi:geranylgeranyl diphosphate synthase type I